jgi:hypothetical protein
MRVYPFRAEPFSAELTAISYCHTCGNVPHAVGPQGSLACVLCAARDAERKAAQSCPDCGHHRHADRCGARVGGVPGFASTSRPCNCPTTEASDAA